MLRFLNLAPVALKSTAGLLMLATITAVLSALLEFVSDAWGELVRADLIFLFGVGFFVVVDWLTGVARALHERRKITSHGLSRTLGKVYRYSVIIFMVIVMENLFSMSRFAVVTDHVLTFTAGYIVWRELLSIAENVWGGKGPLAKFIGGIKALAAFVRKPSAAGLDDAIDAAGEDEDES